LLEFFLCIDFIVDAGTVFLFYFKFSVPTEKAWI